MKKLTAFILSFSLAMSVMALSVHGPDKNAYIQKTFVLQGDSISVAGANALTGGSLKLFDLPEGFLLIHGVVMDVLPTGDSLSATGEASSVSFTVGTSQNATGNGAISATESNLCGILLGVYSSGVTRAQAQLATSTRIDGSATAADLYLNAYTTNALVTNASVTVIGEITVTYSVVGDD